MPDHHRYDLSSEPLLSARVEGATTHLSIAGLLTALGCTEDVALTTMQPHQQHPWHAFVVQLAAILLHRAGETVPRQDEETWRRWMQEATGGVEGWCLVVSDLSKPAFFQPPVPERKWTALKEVHRFAGELDVLVTAKNHDVKARRMANATPEHWAHVLLTLQTSEGFSGRGNYGIARMNGGFGSRPCVAYAPRLAWGVRFTRDVQIALEERTRLVETYGYTSKHALLWLEPWTGKDSLALRDLDPYFIEVCRRVRLRQVEEVIVAHRAATTAPRVEAKEFKGSVGDLWTPVKSGDGAALTASAAGFGYRQLSDLLFGGDWVRPPALRLRRSDGEEPVLIAQVMVRGQGKTEGLHERVVRVEPSATPLLLDLEGEGQVLAELSRSRVDRVRDIQRRVLRPALCALLQGAPDKLDLKDGRADPFVAQHDRAVDGVFFEALWEGTRQEPAEARRDWDRRVFELAKDVFDRACNAVPLPSSHRYRVLSAAQATLMGAARKHLSDLFTTEAPAEPARGDERCPSLT